jgi:RNA polymerase sigma factor (TIGR02999 family)
MSSLKRRDDTSVPSLPSAEKPHRSPASRVRATTRFAVAVAARWFIRSYHRDVPMNEALPPATGPVTQWLDRLRAGEKGALDPLMQLVYDELREAARRQLRLEGRDHTLGPTALVHEVYLRLQQQRQIEADHRADFIGIASRVMRRILVDYARARKRAKRGAGAPTVPIEEVEAAAFLSDEEADEVLALDQALTKLSTLDPRAGQVVECRFYGGLTLEETAAALSMSSKTVQRTWETARAWLRKEIRLSLDT